MNNIIDHWEMVEDVSSFNTKTYSLSGLQNGVYELVGISHLRKDMFCLREEQCLCICSVLDSDIVEVYYM